MKGVKIGFALSGSFCTFEQALGAMGALGRSGAELCPILSFNAGAINTRFGTATSLRERVFAICGREPIDSIELAEPIGPKKMFDVVVVAPATGNTLAKLALGVTDTPVAMAAKSHLRNGRPVVVAVSTNDGLSSSILNIGALLNRKNYYFVPFKQDDWAQKPNSLVADFSKLEQTIERALCGEQIQPILAV